MGNYAMIQSPFAPASGVDERNHGRRCLMALDRIINVIIFVGTLVCYALCFREDGRWSVKTGVKHLKFFTNLSNLFSAFAALCVLLTLRETGLPYWVWILKYTAAVSVVITFLTVMVFLGPTLGYKYQLEGMGIFVHVIGPLLALYSFCFLENFYTLPFGTSLLGLVPLFLYGMLYLQKVVIRKEWDDFYGFNKGGKWKLSFAVMVIAGILVGVLFWALYRLP
jgi:hypothetical protein